MDIVLPFRYVLNLSVPQFPGCKTGIRFLTTHRSGNTLNMVRLLSTTVMGRNAVIGRYYFTFMFLRAWQHLSSQKLHRKFVSIIL